ncbi:TrmH family RNA methyltransferase [Alphaproteobacteria bacterium LSUCC0719]
MHPDRGKKRPARPRPKTAPHRRQHPADGGRQQIAGPKPPGGAHFLWGRHAVLAALANSERRVATLHATTDAAAELRAAIAALPAARRDELPTITETERKRLDAVTSTAARTSTADGDKVVHQGMLAAVWPLDAPDLADFLDSTTGAVRLLCLDQLSDPRNVGAILRSGLALGASAVITTHRHAPEESGLLARAAAGALEHLPMIRVVNLARAIETMQQAEITVTGLAADGEMEVRDLAAIDRLAIVLGGEGAGLRHLTRRHCDHLVRIEISSRSESLNVSIAAAIALHAAGNTGGHAGGHGDGTGGI